MATDKGSLTMIDDLVAELKANETLAARKANTVTSAIGGLATILATAGATWIESGTTLPSWMPVVVLILGMLSTTYGVSKTKNGMTESVATKLHSELTKRIDLNHIHELEVELPVSSKAQQVYSVDQALELRSQVDDLIANHQSKD